MANEEMKTGEIEKCLEALNTKLTSILKELEGLRKDVDEFHRDWSNR